MERLDQILNIVSTHERVDVTTLSQTLGVSKVTIRKDLDKLESRGLLHREHGFAVLNSGDDLNVRLSFEYPIKRKIAQAAAQLVTDHETVMIESGSTCALLAEAICQERRGVTIITNSTFIADYIKDYDSCQVVLLGGAYQKNSQVTVGPLVKEMLKFFHVKRTFIGADGFDEKLGFMGKDLMRTEVVQRMAEVSDEIIVLTDASKFGQSGTVSQFSLSGISQVITDDRVSKELEVKLALAGIELKKV